MKNLVKISAILLVVSTLINSCTQDNEVNPSDFFTNVSILGDNSVFAFPGEPVEVTLSLRASEGINALTQNGNAISLEVDEDTDLAGEVLGELTTTYTVPSTTNVDTELTVVFELTDEEGNKDEVVLMVTTQENPMTFSQLEMIDLGAGEGAAEISAYDTLTKQLFVVNNDEDAGNNRIDVLDFEDPSDLSLVTSIDLASYGGGANSVAVSQGRLAVAVQANTATDNGVVLVWETDDLASAPVEITVGALPDMVAFSPDGNWLVVANEGEPNDDYNVDPEGTISIIDVSTSTPALSGTATFTAFNAQEAALEAQGLRVFGPGASLAEDVEPEYVAISDDSETAYVTLQENNGVAVVDIASATVTDILPLGFKDYTKAGNEIDPSNADGGVFFRSGVSFPLFGTYQPDAIAYFNIGTEGYLITANEGDARDYDGFVGEERLSDVMLDPSVFPEADDLQEDASFGRLNMMLDLGDTDNDGDYDAIYSYGARSFTIWDAEGTIVSDSGNDLDQRALSAGIYADGRSDDKSVEPEGVVVGLINDKTYAFVGLERVDAVAIYDVSIPSSPAFVDLITVGDAPEGLIFIPAAESPNGRSLLVVSSEDDGTVRVYQTNL